MAQVLSKFKVHIYILWCVQLKSEAGNCQAENSEVKAQSVPRLRRQMRTINMADHKKLVFLWQAAYKFLQCFWFILTSRSIDVTGLIWFTVFLGRRNDYMALSRLLTIHRVDFPGHGFCALSSPSSYILPRSQFNHYSQDKSQPQWKYTQPSAV